MSVVILVAGQDFLPANANKMETVLLVFCGAVSVGFWTALTGFIFRKDRTEALAACRQAVTLKPLAIVSLVIFLGTGIWFCVRMASDGDATLSALLFVLASVFVWFTRRRPA